MIDLKIFGTVFLSLAFLSSTCLAQTKIDVQNREFSKAEIVTSNGTDLNKRTPKLINDTKVTSKKGSLKNEMKLPDLGLRKTSLTERLGGVIGTGGGNGIQSSDGKITPLEVLFAQENKPLTANELREKFPEAFKYFQEQINKISKTIPSFAKDIHSTFTSLNWTVTNLENYFELGHAACLNSIGVFKVRSGNKQVVIACQKTGGEIILSAQAIKLLKKPEYLGVIFLHETFVNRMLYSFYDGYTVAEERMITKVMPYILSNQTLDAKILYEHAGSVGFHSYAHYDAYSLEVFEDERISFEKIQSALMELKDEKQTVLKALQEFNSSTQVIRNCPSIDGDLEKYMRNYFDMRNLVAGLISRYKRVLNSDIYLSYSYKEPAINDQIMIEQIDRDLFKHHDGLMDTCVKASR